VEDLEGRQVPSAFGVVSGLLGSVPAAVAAPSNDQHGSSPTITITISFSPLNRSVNAVESLLRNFERNDSPGLSRLTQGLSTPPAATPPSSNPTAPAAGPGSTPSTPPALVAPPLNLPGEPTTSPASPQLSPAGPSQAAQPAGTFAPLPTRDAAAVPPTQLAGPAATQAEGGPSLIGNRSTQPITTPSSGGGDVEETLPTPPADDPNAAPAPMIDPAAPQPMEAVIPPEPGVETLEGQFAVFAPLDETAEVSSDDWAQPAAQEGWDSYWLSLTLAGVALAAEGVHRGMGAKPKTPAPPALLHPPA